MLPSLRRLVCDVQDRLDGLSFAKLKPGGARLWGAPRALTCAVHSSAA
jgi:hypothetical protein